MLVCNDDSKDIIYGSEYATLHSLGNAYPVRYVIPKRKQECYLNWCIF